MDSAVEDAPVDQGGPTSQQPPWILERQRKNWLGTWEPTGSGQGVFEVWITAEPPPFEGFNVGGPHCACPVVHHESSRVRDDDALKEFLKNCVYPPDESPSVYDPQPEATTDAEGWCYASAPNRVHEVRLGGRGGQRFGDSFRQRWWKRSIDDTGAAAGVRARPMSAFGPSEPSDSRVRRVPVVESRDGVSSLVGGAFGALSAVLGDRPLSKLPMDPMAVFWRSRKDSLNYELLCRRLPAWAKVKELLELCVASLYMRAAYGFVARTGMIDSVESGARTFSYQKIAFDITEDVCDASNTNAFIDMLNLKSEDLVCAQWRPQASCEPVYVVARDHQLRWVVVTIRGTLSTKDILTDMAVRDVEFLEGFAHEGMVCTARRLLDDLRDVLRAELQVLEGYRLVFCGHSMGGGVAALAAAQLRHEAEPWASDSIALTVGTPGMMSRCIGERLRHEGAVITVVNNRDWSPRFSVSATRELLDDLCELGAFRSISRAVASIATTGTEECRSGEEEAAHEQLPPGEILQIVHSSGCPAARPLLGPAPRLLSANPPDYRRSMPVWPDVEAHLPIHYVRGLLEGVAMQLRREHRSTPATTPEATAASFLFAEEAAVGTAAMDSSTSTCSTGRTDIPEIAPALAALRRCAAQGVAAHGSQTGAGTEQDAARLLVADLAPLLDVALGMPAA